PSRAATPRARAEATFPRAPPDGRETRLPTPPEAVRGRPLLRPGGGSVVAAVTRPRIPLRRHGRQRRVQSVLGARPRRRKARVRATRRLRPRAARARSEHARLPL